MIRILKYTDSNSVQGLGQNDYAIGQTHKVVATNNANLNPGDTILISFNGSVGYAGRITGIYTGTNPWSSEPDKFPKKFTIDGMGHVGKTMLKEKFVQKINELNNSTLGNWDVFSGNNAPLIEENDSMGIAILKIIPEMC